MSDQNYYQQYVSYSDTHYQRTGEMPSYREWLEGRLAIAEARIAELEAPREGILADAQRLRGSAPAVNAAAGQMTDEDAWHAISGE
jgi:hypothetical protein